MIRAVMLGGVGMVKSNITLVVMIMLVDKRCRKLRSKGELLVLTVGNELVIKLFYLRG